MVCKWIFHVNARKVNYNKSLRTFTPKSAYMHVILQISIKSRLCSLINSFLKKFSLRIMRKWTPFRAFLQFTIYNLSTSKPKDMTNHKGTLCIRQHKDHVHVKILYNSSYFRVRKAFTNHKASLRFIKGLVKYA